MGMTLDIYAPAGNTPLPKIEWNYAEIRAYLETQLEAYKGRVYSDSMIKDAKKDAATLRKLSTAIDGKRKEMKARYLEPYSEFEAQAKELTGMIDAQVNEISAQIHEYEEHRKAEKMERIKGIYADKAEDLVELVPFEKVSNPKWTNVTYSEANIEIEIAERVDVVRAALRAIDSLGLDKDVIERIKSVYFRTLDLGQAMAEKDRIEAERAKLAEYEAKQKAKAQEPQEVERPADIPEYATIVPPAPKPPLVSMVDFRIWATAEQLERLKKFLIDNGIRYGKVPNYR